MIVNKERIKISVIELLLLLCSILFFVGIRYWFPVCEVMGDSPMRCHWAGEVLKASSVVMIVLAAAHLFAFDEKVKVGLDMGTLGLYTLALLIPGRVIPLCMSAEMHCRSHTEPWTIAFMAALILLSIADIVFYVHRVSSQKHKRKQTEPKK